MKLENRSPHAGHARLHAARPSNSDLPESHGHGQRTKPSPAFDSKDSSNGTGGFSHTLRTLPLSVGGTLLLSMLLVTLAAAVALRMPDPAALLTPLSWGSVGIASFFGGILSGRRNPASPVAGALLSGFVVALLLTVVGLCLGGFSTLPVSWLVRLGVILIHLLGGYVARPREKPAAHQNHSAGHRYSR